MDKGGANVAEFTLTATPRATGKAAARQLRRQGQVPAVLYGPGMESQTLAIDHQMLARVYEQAGASQLVDVTIAGRDERYTVLIKDVSRHPVRGTYDHVDLYRVPMDRPIVARVPIRIQGRDQRPNDGGLVAERLHEVEVRCLPAHLPEAIVVDVSGMAVGDTLYVSDLQPGEGVEILDAPDEPVVAIVEPAAPAVEEAEETEAAAETGAPAAEETET